MQERLRKIVVAVDNSPYALNGVRWGARLAKEAGSELTLVHVIEFHYLSNASFAEITSAFGIAPIEHAYDNYMNAMRERGKNILAAAEEVCHSLEVQSESTLAEGIFYETIKELTEDANLLVLGRKGDHSNFGLHLLGAEGERAIRHVNCSCLIVPENYNPLKKIVVGVHNSGPSRAAMQWGEYFLTLYPNTDFRALHVIEDAEKAEDLEGYRTARIGNHKIEILEGNPEHTLAEACMELPEETLCLIGATGHSRTLKEMILGTIPFHLLHKIKGPILLAR